MSKVVCEKCGELAHRSRGRGLIESLIKKSSKNRLYHCHKCGWRGWMVKKQFTPPRNVFRTVVLFLVVLMVTIAGAFYLTRNMTNQAPPPVAAQ